MDQSDSGSLSGGGPSAGNEVRRGVLVDLQKALLDLARIEGRCSTLEAGIQACTETSANTLGVERSSVWLFDPDRTMIECMDLYERSTGRHGRDMNLMASSYPVYFREIDDNRTLAADDAEIDPRTSELYGPYLEPRAITSMLDAPIRCHGEVVGIVCQEHVGAKRIWTSDEQHFAGSIADMVALTLEHFERLRVEDDLRVQETLLEGVAKAAQQMSVEKEKGIAYRDNLLGAVAEIATCVASEPERSKAVRSILASLGMAAKLQVARIFEFRSGPDAAATLEAYATWSASDVSDDLDPMLVSQVVKAPIQIRGRFWGYLEATYSDPAREWTPAEESFITAAASCLGSVLGE